jgi:hypothetical protein
VVKTRVIGIGFVVVSASAAACTSSETSQPTGLVARGLITDDGSLTVFVAPRPLTADEIATIDSGGTIDTTWIRLQMPYAADGTEIDLEDPTAAGSFAEQWQAPHPVDQAITQFRVDFTPGQAGLSGSVKSEPMAGVDDVHAVEIEFAVKFDGVLAWYDPTIEAHLSFDSANTAVLIPEGGP